MSATHQSFHPFLNPKKDEDPVAVERRHPSGQDRFYGRTSRHADVLHAVTGRSGGALTSNPRLIYVVDECPGLAELAKAILEAEGFRVCAFRDRVRAWQAFVHADPRPKLLVTADPGGELSGIELIRRCRTLEPGLKTLWASHRNPSCLPKRDLALLDGFQPRPWCGPLLVEAIRRLCGPLSGAIAQWHEAYRLTW